MNPPMKSENSGVNNLSKAQGLAANQSARVSSGNMFTVQL